MTNTDALNKVIELSGYKRDYIARQLEISPTALRMKICNITEFKASEIYKLKSLLEISDEQVDSIFFAS